MGESGANGRSGYGGAADAAGATGADGTAATVPVSPVSTGPTPAGPAAGPATAGAVQTGGATTDPLPTSSGTRGAARPGAPDAGGNTAALAVGEWVLHPVSAGSEGRSGTPGTAGSAAVPPPVAPASRRTSPLAAAAGRADGEGRDGNGHDTYAGGDAEDDYDDEYDEGEDSGVGSLLRRSNREHTRPRGRWARRLLVTVLVLVLVVAGACVGAELFVRSQVESAIRSALPGLSADAEIGTEGLLLPQVAGGELDALTISADRLVMESRSGGDSTTLVNVDSSMDSVSLSRRTAGRMTFSGTVDRTGMAQMVTRAASDVPDPTVGIGVTGSGDDPGTLVVSAEVFGVPATMTLVPSITDEGGLLMTITSVTMAGNDVDLHGEIGGRPLLSYIGLESEEIPVDTSMLPQGTTLTRVAVTEAGLRLTVSGTDVPLGGR